jgi:hypothetical protein
VFVDQGYTGEAPAAAAAAHGIRLEVVKLPEAKRGFVLLPRRWVIERGFAWTGRFRRLARDDERVQPTLEGFHSVVFAWLALTAVRPILAVLRRSPYQALAEQEAASGRSRKHPAPVRRCQVGP